jgi:hypothetical protein
VKDEKPPCGIATKGTEQRVCVKFGSSKEGLSRAAVACQLCVGTSEGASRYLQRHKAAYGSDRHSSSTTAYRMHSQHIRTLCMCMSYVSAIIDYRL